MTQSRYDVIIVGAGLVGLALAGLLAKRHLRVAIVETGNIEVLRLQHNEYQLRVSAINLASKDLLVHLNAWEKLIEIQRLAPYEKMFVWDSVGRGEIGFACTQIARPCLGYIIENAVIYQALLQALNEQDNIKILSNHQPIAMAMDKSGIKLSMQSGDSGPIEILGELLVGADGAFSWVRDYAKFDTYTWSYHHEALVTNVAVEKTHQKTAWQCFLPEGPLALLPLYQKDICSIVWSSVPQKMQYLKGLNDEDFNREITRVFEFKLGKITRISKTIIFPLAMRHAKRYVTQRVALVGDAAHTIHPLAGQGVNLGFADACSLAECVVLAKKRYKDCGEYRSLRVYERERKADNWVMIFGMEFFKRLFQNPTFFMSNLRRIGLEFVDKNDIIKNQFIDRAIGKSCEF